MLVDMEALWAMLPKRKGGAITEGPLLKKSRGGQRVTIPTSYTLVVDLEVLGVTRVAAR